MRNMFNSSNKDFEDYCQNYLNFVSNNKIPPSYMKQCDEEIIISKNFKLLKYFTKKSKNPDRAFLIVPSIFNSPEILFLNKNKSFIDNLKQFKKDIFLIEWNEISDGEYSLENYIEEVIKTLSFLSISYRKVDLIGHCIGGNLALAALCFSKHVAASLTLLTSPWDCSHLKMALLFYKNLNLDIYVKQENFVPKIYIQILFFLLFPNNFFQKISKFFTLKNEDDKELFFKIEEWLMSGIDLPRKAYFEIIHLMQNNLFAQNQWIIFNKAINPELIKIPTFLLIAKKDFLVPSDSINMLKNALGNVKLLEMDNGHINYLVGKQIKVFFRIYKKWIEMIL